MTISRQAKAAASGRKIRTARAAKRAADLAPMIKTIQASGVTSMRGIATALNARNIPTPTGRKTWQAVQVRRRRKRPRTRTRRKARVRRPVV
jgi:hypothetical protein